jgi:hypothetical protein
MKPSALRSFRDKAKLSLKELSKLAKVAESTITRLQSPAATTRGDTVQRLADALKCHAFDIANGPIPPPSVVEAEARAKEPPARSTLSTGAAWERNHGVAETTIETPIGSAPLLGFETFKQAFSSPKSFAGRPFVVAGVPDDYYGVGAKATEAIGGEYGVAMRFRLVRKVNVANEVCPILFYSTTYIREVDHSDAMRDALHAERAVVLLTRLVHKSRAFTMFEADHGRPRDLGFVVEDILPSGSLPDIEPVVVRHRQRSAG